jgi:hypothetical protein
MGLFFDNLFTQLLRIGDIEGAIALLLKKYPHLKNERDQQARYVKLYSARLSYINATNVGH